MYTETEAKATRDSEVKNDRDGLKRKRKDVNHASLQQSRQGVEPP